MDEQLEAAWEKFKNSHKLVIAKLQQRKEEVRQRRIQIATSQARLKHVPFEGHAAAKKLFDRMQKEIE